MQKTCHDNSIPFFMRDFTWKYNYSSMNNELYFDRIESDNIKCNYDAAEP